MPPEPPRDPAAFTVLPAAPPAPAAPPPRVNVVKPMQHDDLSPNTILDPKFSRALDLKLRRLKEKEVLQANLRRAPPARRGGALAAPEPEMSGGRGGARPRPRREAPAPAERPRFVTTVRAGRFLLPPPEIACLLGLDTLYPAPERERLVYSYASKPKAVPRDREPGPARRDTQPARHQGPAPAPRGAPLAPGDAPRAPARGPGALFGGMRSLMAGVVGMTHMLDKSPTGSVAPYNNVMHEKRVVRGSTFGAHPHAAGDGLESAAARAARSRRRALARRAAAARLRPGTPPPAPGRRHHPIQTEYYLEELFDKGAEYEVGVQTDLFADRPATPPYVPAKTGADAATQIYPGDLFDFDLEAQPVLDALVGKTCEQALAEAAQEEELETLREQQRRYCELRSAERAERARLAAQHARLHREKERRVAEARVAQHAALEARERAAAAALVQGYVAELLPAVLAGLRDQGYLLERVHRGVDEEFMPWLAGEVAHEMETILTSRDVITEIVRDVVEARAELYRAAGEREAAAEPPEDSISPPSTLGEEEETIKAVDE